MTTENQAQTVEDLMTKIQAFGLACYQYESGDLQKEMQAEIRAALTGAIQAPEGAQAAEIQPLPQAEFDALMDHIYEYGTMSEGITARARAMCQAYARAALRAALAAPAEDIADLRESAAMLNEIGVILRNQQDRFVGSWVEIVRQMCEALAAPAPQAMDVERLIRECLPGGHSCDPQAVADAIREWAKAAPQAPVALTDDEWRTRDSSDTDEGCAALMRAHGIPAPQTKEPTNDR